jgi:hypothetical protein
MKKFSFFSAAIFAAILTSQANAASFLFTKTGPNTWSPPYGVSAQAKGAAAG